MKIIFKKDENSQISVSSKVDDHEQEFSYVEMIKDLIETRILENPEISGEFTEAEIKSINSMIRFINEEIGTTEISNSAV